MIDATALFDYVSQDNDQLTIDLGEPLVILQLEVRLKYKVGSRVNFKFILGLLTVGLGHRFKGRRVGASQLYQNFVRCL